ncbi:MAG: hypothetical protein ACYDGN_10495 [Acidimicrobiales bacterium]
MMERWLDRTPAFDPTPESDEDYEASRVDLERLGGGFWSAAYAFRNGGRELVVRFGQGRSWFEADRSAMAYSSADLPVPEVLDIGDALEGSYAISVRHYGTYLESIAPKQATLAAPMLPGLFEALFVVPKGPDLAVDWHWQPPQPKTDWRDWVLGNLVHDANRDPSRWEEKLASEPKVERLFRAADARVLELALQPST